jgi:putative membrane protein
MNIETVFSEKDRQDIEVAVRAAERTTAGEIVPVVVERSGHYDDAVWRAATLGALTAVLGAAIAHGLTGQWGVASWLWLVGPAVVGAAFGFLAARTFAVLRRLLVHPHDLDQAVRRRAALAFVDNEVFNTRERTGILIFLSLFERRVVVLGDSGINAKVEQREWDALVGDLAAGIKAGRTAAALVTAIAQCGQLLQRRGVAIRDDDTDELPDQLRLEQE